MAMRRCSVSSLVRYFNDTTYLNNYLRSHLNYYLSYYLSDRKTDEMLCTQAHRRAFSSAYVWFG